MVEYAATDAVDSGAEVFGAADARRDARTGVRGGIRKTLSVSASCSLQNGGIRTRAGSIGMKFAF